MEHFGRLSKLRKQLVELCLKWEKLVGVAPSITSAISEYDAMVLVGINEENIIKTAKDKTSRQKGYDFINKGIKYQVKANRPSYKKNSPVTITSKAKNYDFDKLIWILYDSKFIIQEAWICEVNNYKEKLGQLKEVRPKHIREIGKII